MPSNKSKLEYLSLYSINKFYVELVYNTSTNKIIDVNSFKEGKGFEKYFPNIDITI